MAEAGHNTKVYTQRGGDTLVVATGGTLEMAGTLAVTGDVTNTGTNTHGGTDAAAVKGMYVSGTIAVAVPTIADAEVDEVAVDIAAMTFAAAVGDAVIAIPLEALPTDCLLLGAYVSATDTVTVSFGAKEGGAGVTGANKNFKFLLTDLT